MRESFDHRATGWIGQSRKCCAQSIHNHMVVDYRAMSSVDFSGWQGWAAICLVYRICYAAMGLTHMYAQNSTRA